MLTRLCVSADQCAIKLSLNLLGILRDRNESLFAYDRQVSFEDLYRPMYTPVFEATFTDPDLRATAEEMCEGNQYCLFDIAATGDTSIGMDTFLGVQELEAIINASWPGI